MKVSLSRWNAHLYPQRNTAQGSSFTVGFYHDCFIGGIAAVAFSKDKQDRRYRFKQTCIGAKAELEPKLPGISHRFRYRMSGYDKVQRGFHKNWAYSCPKDMAITHLASIMQEKYLGHAWVGGKYVAKYKRDRVFNIGCSKFNGLGIRKGGWPSWQTNWFAPFKLSCGN